jgi:hypothetical protein
MGGWESEGSKCDNLYNSLQLFVVALADSACIVIFFA